MNRSARIPFVLALSGSLVGLTLLAPGQAPATVHRFALPGCAWAVVDNPDLGPRDSGLSGIDALAGDDVWAVGSMGRFAHEKTLIEHFDGAAWAVVASPNPRRLSTDGNVLNAVEVLTPTDMWAVGTHFNNGHTSSEPLILHSDGERWRVVDNPPGSLTNSFLRGVTAVSSDDVWAVGARFAGGPGERDPLILHWNGAAWSIVKAPNPDGVEADFLASVSAVSTDDVWAVGQANEATTLTMHFDGNRWRIVHSPTSKGSRTGLAGVVARAGDDVWAVGAVSAPNGSLSLHWDGIRWRVVPTRHRPQFDWLAAVATAKHGNLWAVGSNQTPDSTYLTFAERFDGTAWKLSETPSPGLGDRLLAVTTIDSGVWAVGVTAVDPQSVGHVLIEHHC